MRHLDRNVFVENFQTQDYNAGNRKWVSNAVSTPGCRLYSLDANLYSHFLELQNSTSDINQVGKEMGKKTEKA